VNKPPEMPGLGTPGEWRSICTPLSPTLRNFVTWVGVPSSSKWGERFSTAGPTWRIGWTATRCSERTILGANRGGLTQIRPATT
jgi:hypothetical protein